MDATTVLARARSLLEANGLPINAANLNRASLAVARGQTSLEPEGDADRLPARSVQTRRPLVRDGNRVPLTANANPVMDAINAQIEATPAEASVAPQQQSQQDVELPAGADLAAAFPGASGGGENVTAGDAVRMMLGDQLLPLAAAAMAPAGRAALPNIRLGMNRQAIEGGTTNAARIGGGADGAGRAIAGSGSPQLGGPSGAAAALPAPQRTLPAQQRALPSSTRYNDPPPSQIRGDISSLTPAQRAAALGPGEASEAAMAASRALANRRRSGNRRPRRRDE